MAAIEQAQIGGLAITAAVLAYERAANSHGAQDVRTLFSLDGGRTLMLFEGLIDTASIRSRSTLPFAVSTIGPRVFRCFHASPAPPRRRQRRQARTARAAIKEGTHADGITRMIEAGAAPYRIHPISAGFADAIDWRLRSCRTRTSAKPSEPARSIR
jgi:hypothetical protein